MDTISSKEMPIHGYKEVGILWDFCKNPKPIKNLSCGSSSCHIIVFDMQTNINPALTYALIEVSSVLQFLVKKHGLGGPQCMRKMWEFFVTAT